MTTFTPSKEWWISNDSCGLFELTNNYLEKEFEKSIDLDIDFGIVDCHSLMCFGISENPWMCCEGSKFESLTRINKTIRHLIPNVTSKRIETRTSLPL